MEIKAHKMAKYKGGKERDYNHDKEQELWDEFRYKAIDPMKSDWVMITQMANQMGIHQMTTREMARTWNNSGLVISGTDQNRIKITEKGKYTVDPRKPGSKG